jgi:hypothetical protein
MMLFYGTYQCGISTHPQEYRFAVLRKKGTCMTGTPKLTQNSPASVWSQTTATTTGSTASTATTQATVTSYSPSGTSPIQSGLAAQKRLQRLVPQQQNAKKGGTPGQDFLINMRKVVSTFDHHANNLVFSGNGNKLENFDNSPANFKSFEEYETHMHNAYEKFDADQRAIRNGQFKGVKIFTIDDKDVKANRRAEFDVAKSGNDPVKTAIETFDNRLKYETGHGQPETCPSVKMFDESIPVIPKDIIKAVATSIAKCSHPVFDDGENIASLTTYIGKLMAYTRFTGTTLILALANFKRMQESQIADQGVKHGELREPSQIIRKKFFMALMLAQQFNPENDNAYRNKTWVELSLIVAQAENNATNTNFASEFSLNEMNSMWHQVLEILDNDVSVKPAQLHQQIDALEKELESNAFF